MPTDDICDLEDGAFGYAPVLAHTALIPETIRDEIYRPARLGLYAITKW